MAKHSSNDADDVKYTDGDSPIGLTGAFAPVEEVQDDSEFYDDPLGLTQAFGAVSEDEDWDEGKSKWEGFDWNAPVEGTDDADASENAAGDSVEDDFEDDEFDAFDDEGDDDDKPRGRHAAHAKAAEEEEEAIVTPTPRLSAWKEERMRKSRRTRRSLIIVIVLLICLLVAGGVFAYHILSEGQNEAEQQTQQHESATEKNEIASGAAQDATTVAVKTVDVPNLISLLGMDQVEAVDALKRGATITATRTVKEEGNPIRSSVTIALTSEPSDSKTGTPNVYLGLDREGKVIQAGYSASASTLGFGAVGFADAVEKDHVVEQMMKNIGLTESIGTIKLPSDKSEYTTYAKDGTTLVRERCPFSGNVTINGQDCTWSSVLSYDYTTANLTGNVDDTVRVMYAYITENVPYEPDPEPEGEEGGEEGAEGESSGE